MRLLRVVLLRGDLRDLCSCGAAGRRPGRLAGPRGCWWWWTAHPDVSRISPEPTAHASAARHGPFRLHRLAGAAGGAALLLLAGVCCYRRHRRRKDSPNKKAHPGFAAARAAHSLDNYAAAQRHVLVAGDQGNKPAKQLREKPSMTSGTSGRVFKSASNLFARSTSKKNDAFLKVADSRSDRTGSPHSPRVHRQVSRGASGVCGDDRKCSMPTQLAEGSGLQSNFL